MGFYYKCAIDSPLGVRLAQFATEAFAADEAAEAYAIKYGAVAYVQPAQYFAGGVDFLEFKESPDSGVWRKLEDACLNLYEPNCISNIDVGILSPEKGIDSLPNGSSALSGMLALEEVFPLFPLQCWAAKIGYEMMGDRQRDLCQLKERLKGKKFYLVANFTKPEGVGTAQFRKAVEAERVRLRLPVVDVRQLLDILGCWADESNGKVALNATPTFFRADSSFYIHCQMKGCSPDLEVVSGAEYDDKETRMLGLD